MRNANRCDSFGGHSRGPSPVCGKHHDTAETPETLWLNLSDTYYLDTTSGCWHSRRRPHVKPAPVLASLRASTSLRDSAALRA